MEWLQTQRVRNLDNIYLQPSPKLNIFTGPNASGKTAVLESIVLLSRAQSFRTTRIQDVIQHKEESLLVTSKIHHEQEGVINTGIEKRYGEVVIKTNGERIKTVSNQAKKLPFIVITQDIHGLITGSPKQRRHWLDWAMFHVEPGYLELWKRYVRALRHRNFLLKERRKKRELYRGWEEAMVESANLLTEQRRTFLSSISQYIDGMSDIEVTRGVSIQLLRGWAKERDYLTVLDESWAGDLERGHTRSGIQQADIDFSVNGRKIASYYSRGQIKLFTVFLLLAQAKQIERMTGVKPIVIIDDFRAELDKNGSKYILTWLQNEGFQSFLSTTEVEQEIFGGFELQRFHVEHGKIIRGLEG